MLTHFLRNEEVLRIDSNNNNYVRAKVRLSPRSHQAKTLRLDLRILTHTLSKFVQNSPFHLFFAETPAHEQAGKEFDISRTSKQRTDAVKYCIIHDKVQKLLTWCRGRQPWGVGGRDPPDFGLGVVGVAGGVVGGSWTGREILLYMYLIMYRNYVR